MALGLLLVLFMVMSIISVMGLVLLFLLKGEKGQKAVFYFMAVWGMVIAWMTANSYPTNYIKEQLISLGVWCTCCDCTADTDLWQKRKIFPDSKGVGSGICCARNGGSVCNIM